MTFCTTCHCWILGVWVLLGASELAEANFIRIRVIEDHSGNPVASADVRILRADTGALFADLDSDRNGHIEVPGVPASAYRLEVSKPGFVSARVQLRVQENVPAAVPVVIHLVRCGVITGRVIEASGAALEGAMVSALLKPARGVAGLPLENHTRGNLAVTDSSGEYRLYNLAPGQYNVVLSYGASTFAVGVTGSSVTRAGVGSGFLYYPENSRPQWFTIAGGDEMRGVDFNVLPTSLTNVSGTIKTAAPAGGSYWLALALADQPGIAVAVSIAESDGSFRFEGVHAGSYHLFASGPSTFRGSFGAGLPEQPYFARTELQLGAQSAEGITLDMQRGRSASFALRAAAGSVPKGCSSKVQLQLLALEDWGAILMRDITLDFTRPVVVENLAPARYHVPVTRLGEGCYSAADMIVDLTGASPSGPVEVSVVPAGSIVGKLIGAARAADFVLVLLDSSAGRDEQPLRVAYPDDKAGFVFEGLSPGRYRIAARPTAAAHWVADAGGMVETDVAGGAPTRVELRASNPGSEPAEKP
jgi:hypothetical protein